MSETKLIGGPADGETHVSPSPVRGTRLFKTYLDRETKEAWVATYDLNRISRSEYIYQYKEP